MKLMKQAANDRFPEKVLFSWFTAWDPSIEKSAIGDAMLYRFFKDIADQSKDKKVEKYFDELQVALGHRKSSREHASGFLDALSDSIPSASKPVIKAAKILLAEFSSQKKALDSFKDLAMWLENNKKTAFFFIDDLDRAMGAQIRDILSELKVYVSHPRIVTIFAYDQDYVLKAVGPELPEHIDPKKFLEKIVTLQRTCPVPHRENLIDMATYLLETVCRLETSTAKSLAEYAVNLTSNNPRRLKIVILLFGNHYSLLRSFIETEIKENRQNYSIDEALQRAFFVFIVSSLGFFSDRLILSSFEIGDPRLMRVALINALLNDNNADKKPEIKQIMIWLTVLSDEEDKRIPLDNMTWLPLTRFKGFPSAMRLCQKMSYNEASDIHKEIRRLITSGPVQAELKRMMQEESQV